MRLNENVKYVVTRRRPQLTLGVIELRLTEGFYVNGGGYRHTKSLVWNKDCQMLNSNISEACCIPDFCLFIFNLQSNSQFYRLITTLLISLSSIPNMLVIY